MYCVKCGQQVPDSDRFCTRCGAPMELAAAPQPVAAPPVPVSQPIPVPQPVPQAVPSWPAVAQPLRYAGFWRRFIATLIDGVIVGLLWFVLSGLYEFATTRLIENTAFSPDGAALIRTLAFVDVGRWLLGVLVVLLYFAVPESTKRGASLGKLIMRLRVARPDGGRAGLVRSVARTALKPVSAAPLMLGFVIAGWNHRKRALHDMLSGSVVLRA